MTIRHDAARCREDAKSLQIRTALGIRFPHEIQADQEREAKRRLESAKKLAQGSPLGLEEE